MQVGGGHAPADPFADMEEHQVEGGASAQAWHAGE